MNEHKCLQPFRPEVTWKILHRCNYSMPPTLSVQGKCRSDHSNNRKGDHNVKRSILQTQILFWWTGKKEEGVLLLLSPHWDTSLCGCRSTWGPYQCRLWFLYWWIFHRILVSWYHVWDSTCYHFFKCPPSNSGALLLAGTTVLGSWAFVEYFFYSEYFNILIWSIIDVIIHVRSCVRFFVFSFHDWP